MICKQCKLVGEEQRKIEELGVLDESAILLLIVAHQKCPGGTRCDCQHRVRKDSKA